MSGHATNAAAFVKNRERAHWHDQALWFVRAKRDKAAQQVPEWEQLREAASQIKANTTARLADYLEQFEANALRLGAHVHWARDAAEHNRIVLGILHKHAVKRLVKSKSMLTEECHLNPFLERHGVEVVDTDLGERIVQLAGEPPSHIVLPAIHKTKEDVSAVFHEHLGTPAGAADPNFLAEAARQHLRDRFVRADAGLTGVNFAIAETGGFVVCTNEGNADLGVSLPKLHIACMGIEKLIPRARDLGVFLRLLGRSATGQPITSYSSHFHGPRPGGELHIVLVDNGRSDLLGSQEFRRSLNCIRCGACMNTCPVYRRSGGYSYESTVPGPIGSILSPARDPRKHQSLPHACSLCGSCTDVCPVKIDLHHQLLTWRRELAQRRFLSPAKRFAMQAASVVLQHPGLYRFAGAAARWLLARLPRALVYHRLNPWGLQRELPLPRPRASASYTENVMASREDILRAVRARHRTGPDLPEFVAGIRYDDRRRQFAALLESVGGRCRFVPDLAAVNQALADIKEYASARKVVSLVPGVGRPTVDLDAVADPHDLEDVDFAILPGLFGVAENGAVWVTDAGVKHRVIYHIPQHVALVIAAEQIVDNMHQAYERLSFDRAGFGCFISGPSKTADIEQCLVIGAHGPRSLTVFGVEADQ